MTREMMKRIRQNKANAALLVRYANPNSRKKPTEKEVLDILYRHIPYSGTVRPVIESFTVERFNRNRIIKSADFMVELNNGKSYRITAYQDLTGRTPEQKEEDKTATYPSGLFTIFHTEIKAPEKEPEQKEEVKSMRIFDLVPTDGRKSFYGKAQVIQHDDGSETLTSYNTPIIRRDASGKLSRLYAGYSQTTGRHIKAFCGLDKAGFMALPMEEQSKPTGTGGRTLTNAESYAAMIARRNAG